MASGISAKATTIPANRSPRMLENHSCLARSSMGGFSRLFRIHSASIDLGVRWSSGRIRLLYWDLMGVKKRSGCDNQSQAAGAAEGGVKAALQSRQYAICSWAADDSREALAQVGLSCLAKTPFKFSALQGEYNHILTEVTFLFSVYMNLIYY